MAAFTSIGPIGVRQMNSNLYVGHNDLTTIQAAVTAAAQMGGISTVYIPPEYAGTDSPTAVTGGNSSIYLMDERNGQRQSYLWYNSAYVKEPIIAAGVATPQLNHYIYVGIEGQWPTIQGAVNNAVAGGIGDFVIITTSYGGSETIGSITGGAANVFIVDERTAQRQVYEWNGTNYIPSDFEPLGAIRADLITANDLSVTDASFDTATVADSPVRTFANTPDGPGQGMVWPTPGIPVSLGSTWLTPSIDPEDLATWPPSGIPVSTGTAWSAPINPANVVQLNPDGSVHANSFVSQSGSMLATFGVVPAVGVLTVQAIGAGTYYPPLAIGGIDGDGTYKEYASFDTPTSTIDSALNVNASIRSIQNGFQTTFATETYGTWAVTSAMTSGAPLPNWTFGAIDGNGAYQQYLRLNNVGAYFAYPVSTSTLFLTSTLSFNPSTGNAVQLVAAGNGLLQFNSTNGTLMFVDLNAMVVTIGGELNVAGLKNFRIPHPLDEKKWLFHSCVEGPEAAVFYRGEAETVDGKAEITLPDYFESLVMQGRRTIHLTELYEDEDEPVFGNFLAAGRINNGKFMVRSSTPTVKFYWEVKAVRGDIDPLEVERPIAESVESAKA
jgi:hypothetical protein